MTGLLLDSHVALWVLADSPRLGAMARSAIDDAALTLVSAASVWEISIKVALGRLEAPTPLAPLLVAAGLRELPVDWAGAEAIMGLSLDHGDPFDRLIAAQARSGGLTLLTADRELLRALPEFTRDARE